MKKILEKYPRLISEEKNRSIADPWVIAHAQSENATVVTLEQKAVKADKIKIPNICKEEDMECIDIYDFIKDLNIKFTAKRN